MEKTIAGLVVAAMVAGCSAAETNSSAGTGGCAE